MSSVSFGLLILIVFCLSMIGCAESHELPFRVPTKTILLETDVKILETPAVMIYVSAEDVVPPPGADFPKG